MFFHERAPYESVQLHSLWLVLNVMTFHSRTCLLKTFTCADHNRIAKGHVMQCFSTDVSVLIFQHNYSKSNYTYNATIANPTAYHNLNWKIYLTRHHHRPWSSAELLKLSRKGRGAQWSRWWRGQLRGCTCSLPSWVKTDLPNFDAWTNARE